jgi:hypothetical protein
VNIAKESQNTLEYELESQMETWDGKKELLFSNLASITNHDYLPPPVPSQEVSCYNLKSKGLRPSFLLL